MSIGQGRMAMRPETGYDKGMATGITAGANPDPLIWARMDSGFPAGPATKSRVPGPNQNSGIRSPYD